jgi:hypothetical protein
MPRTKRTSPFKSELQAECFREFYQTYPRRIAVADAEKAYVQMLDGTKKHRTVMAALVAQLPYWEHVKLTRGVESIPYPASWLRGRRWEDELPSMSPTIASYSDPKRYELGD